MTTIHRLDTDCSISAAGLQAYKENIQSAESLTITAITVLGGVLFCTNNLPVIRNAFSLSLVWAAVTTLTTSSLAANILPGLASFHPASRETLEEKHKRIASMVRNSIQLIALIGCGYGFLPLLANSILLTTIVTYLASEFVKDVTEIALRHMSLSSSLHLPTEEKPVTVEI